ncbi:hypothetical protein BS47DRAFT_971984 [Hydnum rufescens UP504]|uniref:Uncharacterized protein n=1 Tax=Hydnum rufescens UP504 TaxID=1448309 RepID=A0A9P6AWN6_9AGAM|nr:hypothetical protein BS47DRAFT_971984 [Hydnum rufescens UP504]
MVSRYSIVTGNRTLSGARINVVQPIVYTRNLGPCTLLPATTLRGSSTPDFDDFRSSLCGRRSHSYQRAVRGHYSSALQAGLCEYNKDRNLGYRMIRRHQYSVGTPGSRNMINIPVLALSWRSISSPCSKTRHPATGISQHSLEPWEMRISRGYTG